MPFGIMIGKIRKRKYPSRAIKSKQKVDSCRLGFNRVTS
jgi:hypothetical protein